MITVGVVFIISFLLIGQMVYRGNKKEASDDKLNVFGVFFVTFLLASIPTIVIAIFIFVFLGSTTAVNVIFSLNLSRSSLILVAVILFIYYFTIDSLVEGLIKYLLGKRLPYFIVLFLVRVLAFYMICLALDLEETKSLLIASTCSLIITIIESMYYLKENRTS